MTQASGRAGTLIQVSQVPAWYTNRS